MLIAKAALALEKYGTNVVCANTLQGYKHAVTLVQRDKAGAPIFVGGDAGGVTGDEDADVQVGGCSLHRITWRLDNKERRMPAHEMPTIERPLTSKLVALHGAHCGAPAPTGLGKLLIESDTDSATAAVVRGGGLADGMSSGGRNNNASLPPPPPRRVAGAGATQEDKRQVVTGMLREAFASGDRGKVEAAIAAAVSAGLAHEADLGRRRLAKM